MCLGTMAEAASRSAIVRATFNIRSWARAVKPLLSHGPLEQALAVQGKFTKRTNVTRPHLRIAVKLSHACKKRIWSTEVHGHVLHGRGFWQSFLVRSRSAAPCSSPRERRYEYRCGRQRARHLRHVPLNN